MRNTRHNPIILSIEDAKKLTIAKAEKLSNSSSGKVSVTESTRRTGLIDLTQLPEENKYTANNANPEPVAKPKFKLKEKKVKDLPSVAAETPPADTKDIDKLTTSTRPDRWGPMEHRMIGDKAFNNSINSTLRDVVTQLQKDGFMDRDNKLLLQNGAKLSAGQICMLSLDFYGVPDKPICEGESKKTDTPESRFLTAFETLNKGDREETAELDRQINAELKVMEKALANGKKPHIALEKMSKLSNVYKQDRAYGNITQYTFLPCSFFYSRYFALAQMNFDHFGNDARIAYLAGHRIAIKTALQAHGIEDEKEKRKQLVRALALEFFACHSLTDLFSSGHMRTPRRALYNHVVQNTRFSVGNVSLAGLLAKEQHDEDCHKGLWVTSPKYQQEAKDVNKKKEEEEKNRVWHARGDGCYGEADNEVNKKRAIDAVEFAISQIFAAYSNKDYLKSFKIEDKEKAIGEAANEILKYIPEVCKSDSRNFHPLFRVNEETKQVEVREKLNDTQCAQYTSKWKIREVLASRWVKSLLKPGAHSSDLSSEDITKQLKDLKEFKEMNSDLEEIENTQEGFFSCGIS